MKIHYSEEDKLEFDVPKGYRTYLSRIMKDFDSDHPWEYLTLVRIACDFNLYPLGENNCEVCVYYCGCNCTYVQMYRHDTTVLYVTVDNEYVVVLERSNAFDYLVESEIIQEFDNFVDAYHFVMTFAQLIRDRKVFYLPFVRHEV